MLRKQVSCRVLIGIPFAYALAARHNAVRLEGEEMSRLFVPSCEGGVSKFVLATPILDELTSVILGGQILSLLDRCGLKVEIDMSRVEYLCSNAITKILRWHRKMSARQGKLTLINVQPFVRDVLEVLGVGRLVEIRPTVARTVA
jgi:anti-anti-sigma factor